LESTGPPLLGYFARIQGDDVAIGLAVSLCRTHRPLIGTRGRPGVWNGGRVQGERQRPYKQAPPPNAVNLAPS
jgi:hypothetical protein